MLPVLLVPGLLCSPEIWSAQQSALWPYGSVQIASTLGHSTVTEIAASILDSAPERFNLAGISLGGYICFEIMRQAPHRVGRLALLDTSARPDRPEQSAGRREMLAAAAGDYLTTAVNGLTVIMRPDRHEDPELKAINERMARTVGLAGFRTQSEAAISRPDSRPILARITTPTLVLVGDSDELTPKQLSEEIVDGLPDARLTIIPKSGHASAIEQPEFVSAELVKWFTGNAN